MGAKRIVVMGRISSTLTAVCAATLLMQGRMGLLMDPNQVTEWGPGRVDTFNPYKALQFNWPLAALLYTDVAKDGMLQGPNLEQTRRLAEAGRVPVIASGGVGSIEHVRQLTELPVWGAIVGRSLYEGTLDLREAIRLTRLTSNR